MQEPREVEREVAEPKTEYPKECEPLPPAIEPVPGPDGHSGD
jgi:hypothetical protein